MKNSKIQKISRNEIQLKPSFKTVMIVGGQEFYVDDIVNISYIINDDDPMMMPKSDIPYQIRNATGKIIEIEKNETGSMSARSPYFIKIDCSAEFSEDVKHIGSNELVAISKKA